MFLDYQSYTLKTSDIIINKNNETKSSPIDSLEFYKEKILSLYFQFSKQLETGQK